MIAVQTINCRFVTLAFIVGVLAFSKTSNAATYYIDPACSSSGDGTTAIPGEHGPLKTWEEVTKRNLWVAGNTYSQKGGTTARENVVVAASGLPDQPITLNSYGEGKATIIAAKDVGTDGWTEYPGGSGIYRKKIGGSRWFWEDGAPLKASYTTTCPDGTFTYGDNYYTYYNPTGNTAPSDHKLLESLWDKVTSGIDIRERSHIIIDGLNLQKGWYGVWHSNNITLPAGNVNVSNVTIRNCTITNFFWGIYGDSFSNCVASDFSISGNYIDYCNCGISSWTASQSVTESTGKQYSLRHVYTKNQIHHLACASDTMLWHDAYYHVGYNLTDHEGISFQHSQDCTVSENLIINNHNPVSSGRADGSSDEYHNRALYIYLAEGGKAAGNVFTRNYIIGRYTPAIYVSGFGDGGFERNTFSYNVVRYSSHDGGHTAFTIHLTKANPATGANLFINNTIYNTATGAGLYPQNCTVTAGKWEIRNNIVRSPNSLAQISSAAAVDAVFSHNIYYGVPAPYSGFMIGTSGMKFSTWNKTFDAVGSSVDKDPLFRRASIMGVAADWAETSAGSNVWYKTYGINPPVDLYFDSAYNAIYALPVVSFNAGTGVKPKHLNIITGASSGAKGEVVQITTTSGKWGTDASGKIYMEGVSGAFQSGEDLQFNEVVFAKASSATLLPDEKCKWYYDDSKIFIYAKQNPTTYYSSIEEIIDFTLMESSPAKWMGMDLGLTTDYAGSSVHNPPSIGAYEYTDGDSAGTVTKPAAGPSPLPAQSKPNP